MPTRRRIALLAGASLALLALGACVPRSAPPAPLPAPAPRPAPAPPAPPPPPRPTADWETGPLSSGDWVYRVDAGVPTAVFGGAGYGPSLTISCTQSRIGMVLRGMEGEMIVLR